MNLKLSIAAFVLTALLLPAAEATDKSQYHLLNPTPKELMREMSTDRPDKTESPYTVDAGHYQMELSFIDFTHDENNPDDSTINNLSVAPINLKAGLCNTVDLQLVMNPYIRERTKTNGDTEKKSGFGDIVTRLKVNLWGNDGGPTALAIMPFIKFPTNTDGLGNDFREGGVIIPLAVSLPGDWGMGLMTEFDFSRNEAKEFYTKFINTITFGHAIVGDLSGYVEFFSKFNDEDDTPWIGTFDTGLTYAMTPDIQFDAGINIGVTESADDLNPFCGVSVRY